MSTNADAIETAAESVAVAVTATATSQKKKRVPVPIVMPDGTPGIPLTRTRRALTRAGVLNVSREALVYLNKMQAEDIKKITYGAAGLRGLGKKKTNTLQGRHVRGILLLSGRKILGGPERIGKYKPKSSSAAKDKNELRVKWKAVTDKDGNRWNLFKVYASLEDKKLNVFATEKAAALQQKEITALAKKSRETKKAKRDASLALAKETREAKKAKKMAVAEAVAEEN